MAADRKPLPVTVKERQEFGYYRTACACRACTLNCEHNPGYLIPADLERLTAHLGTDTQAVLDWAARHLLASPPSSATHPTTGQQVPIRKLVPARKADGSCVFLTDDKRCAVHADAPFGCAFFDCSQSAAEAMNLHGRGLFAVASAWQPPGLYAQVWQALAGQGLVAPSAQEAQQRLVRAAQAEGLI
jgi:hypothetical protein